MLSRYLIFSLCFTALVTSRISFSSAVEIDFNRDIRPILSDKCFHCHGPDAKNQDSEFRLDTKENIFADLGGYFAVVPGNKKESTLLARVHSADESERMPPVDSGRSLSQKQLALLDAWIEQGAVYQSHWSFSPPVRPELPQISEKNQAWAQNPIDFFIAARLEKEGLSPSKEAELETLIRRASLSLTGLQPKINQADDYEGEVDRLLSSIHYAERQALRWLDAARYADTDGFQNDAGRSNWPWRDWVIKAFHENMPFDQFTLEQLAGDMLPEPSNEQILASTFNRNHRQNSEGGALAEEFFVENVIDRIEVTSTVWLGLTTGCARCHDHKYDPLSQKEFYQLFAYFNNIGERGFGKGISANPVLQMTSPLNPVPTELTEKLDAAKQQVKQLQQSQATRLEAWVSANKPNASEKANPWNAISLKSATVEPSSAKLVSQEDDSLLLDSKAKNAKYQIDFNIDTTSITALRIEALPNAAFSKPRQLARSVNGNFVLTDFKLFLLDKSGKQKQIELATAEASFQQDKYPVTNALDNKPNTGWAIFGPNSKPEPATALFILKQPLELTPDHTLRLIMDHRTSFADHNIGQFRLSVTDQQEPKLSGKSGLSAIVKSAMQKPKAKRSKKEQAELTKYFATKDHQLITALSQVTKVEQEIKNKGYGAVPVMVMREKTGDPTPAYLLNRGQYDEPDKSEVLTRGVPEALLLDDQPQPKDRLEFANWLVSKNHPLTARVYVNRVWQDHFGVGLVKTTEDFGAQGETPSHPELLDWLAVEFIESGWDIKALQKLIVTSATYRQSSKVTKALVQKDPENRLLARGPRYRMDGFAIRDMALQASGLLNSRVGGAPVKPYQPTGLWNDVSSGANTRYQPSKGQDLFRKSMYTYWKRAVNPPRQIIFDAGGRETCNVRNRVTNTPLQALVLMNDKTYIEAARNVAEKVLLEKDYSQTAKLQSLYQKVVGRTADSSTTDILSKNLAFFLEHYKEQEDQATALLSIGESQRNETLLASEHAAWTAVAHLVLNLDETITIE